MIRNTLSRSILVSLLAAAPSVLIGQPVAQPPRLAKRLVVVLRDQTQSFASNLSEANQVICRIVANLGPGDRLLLVDIGGGFLPQKQVRETPFPPLFAGVLRSSNAQEYSRNKRQLEDSWMETERIKQRLSQEIARPVSINVANTDIYTPLEYVSGRVAGFDGERYLVLLSDLVTDAAGLKTEGPPRNQMMFPGTKVTALFVPWKPGGKNDSKMKAWRKWFEAAGATFTMHDEVESPGIALIERSSVPKRPGNPLTEAAGRR
jgi:hypothetical protein